MLSVIIMSVIMMSVILLSDIMLIVIMLSATLLSVIMLSVIMLSATLLSVIMLSVIMLSVFMRSVMTLQPTAQANKLYRHPLSMRCFQNALAYFATAVSYDRKMFMKSTIGANIQKDFFSLPLTFRTNKLECLSLA